MCLFPGKACSGAATLQHRNIRALCQALDSMSLLEGSTILQSPVEFADSNEIKLSSGQEQMLILHSLDPKSGFYNQPLVLGLYGALDVDVFDRCIQNMVARQDALRTTYVAGALGTWAPKVAEPLSSAAHVPLTTVDLSNTEVSEKCTLLNPIISVYVLKVSIFAICSWKLDLRSWNNSWSR